MITNPPGRRPRWSLKWLLIVVILAAAVSLTGYLLSKPASTSEPSTTSRPSVPTPAAMPPVQETALAGLLLSAAQINIAMGATTMTGGGLTEMREWSFVEKACQPMNGILQGAVYAGSGWSSSRAQELFETFGNGVGPAGHDVQQGVVSFPSAPAASAFFALSERRWPACSNRQYAITVSGSPDTVITVGPLSDRNGILSATQTFDADGQICQRALTVANNLAIDVMACAIHPAGKIPSDLHPDSAVNIANQIAAKVPK